MPLLLDAALLLVSPLEERLARRHVAEAARRVAAVAPRIVAITGSYGKTSTKGYLAHLLAGRYAVVASPRSFNNRAGLARTVNEHLVPGTDVLVAEMGTYGRGEIAALCAWLPPEVAVITAIGPVHLERFGSLEAILEAKSEITERARHCVLNVDDPRLAALADRLAAAGRAVSRCSGTNGDGVDVAVLAEPAGLCLVVSGRRLGEAAVDPARRPPATSNVACAAAAALALGCSGEELLDRLASLPVVPNRLAVERAGSGLVVLDDTYNSNPAGAELAVSTLAGLGLEAGSRRVVVTPGMVELGRMQAEANEELARRVGEVATDLVVVGRTNRRALLAGAGAAPGANGAAGDRRPHLVAVEHRQDAVEWVRRELSAGDAVLYENDLPDHYP